MNPIESISSVFRNYVNFSGRAQRSEFWWFTLFSFVLHQLILGIIAAAVEALSILEFIFSLAVLLPSLAVTARRLHDTGRSAWWLIILSHTHYWLDNWGSHFRNFRSNGRMGIFA